jgi:hypothetical protein
MDQKISTRHLKKAHEAIAQKTSFYIRGKRGNLFGGI